MKKLINMLRQNIRISIMCVISLLLWQCEEPQNWHDAKDNVPPGPVSDVVVENLNGGARLTYTLPSDEDLMGVKIAYSLTADSEVLERYASAETDTIEIEGFGDTNERQVTLYAVDKSGNVSTGVTQTIKPLTPPIFLMRESLRAMPTFGGISLTWDNEDQKEMGLSLFIPDGTGEMKLFDTYFSNNQNGRVVFRPFESIEQFFLVEMFDRWNNYAEAAEITLVPHEEYQLPGRKSASEHIWRLFDDEYHRFRGDIHNDMSGSYYVNRVFAIVHDGVGQSNSDGTYWNPGNDGDALEKYIPGTGDQGLPWPLYFTVDMGREAVYSRFNIKPRLRSPNYSSNLPCDFEIWGTNNPKLASQVGDGSREANLAYWTSWEIANGTNAWQRDGWVKLATCKLILSSGESKYTVGMTLSEEDVANYRTNGFGFDMNEGVTDGYRYLRWVINDTNTGVKSLQICEIEFWGTYTD